jgi:hypothetical protein
MAEPNQARSVGSLQKHPKPCGQRECEAVFFGIEARMDSFAAVPLKNVEINDHLSMRSNLLT